MPKRSQLHPQHSFFPLPTRAPAQTATASPLDVVAPAVLTDATTRPTAAKKLDVDDLPVEIVELPDGKLRMIYVLRSYGGTTVRLRATAGTTAAQR